MGGAGARIGSFLAGAGCCLLTGLHHSYRAAGAGLHIKPLVLYLNPKRGNKMKRGNKRGNKTMFCCCSQRGLQILSYRLNCAAACTTAIEPACTASTSASAAFVFLVTLSADDRKKQWRRNCHQTVTSPNAKKACYRFDSKLFNAHKA